MVTSYLFPGRMLLGLILLPLLVSAAFGAPAALGSLESAATAPAAGTLEAQAVSAGASFSGSILLAAAPARSGPMAVRELPAMTPKAGEVTSPVVPKPPPLDETKRHRLEGIRIAGFAGASAGFGLFAYAVAAAATGPIGWAAALVFFGGLSAYLAHQALKQR